MYDPTIIQFLEARIAEDERVAMRSVTSRKLGGKPYKQISTGDLLTKPERVLAECEAKRTILSLFKPEDASENADRDSSFYAGGVEDCIYALATVYYNHPDFRSSWGV